MYSGTVLAPMRRFDAWFGAHQKIDRVAREHLVVINQHAALFPTRKLIVAFEGLDGPDGIKRKTPAKNELWHYYDPEDATDTQVIEIIENHYIELVRALKAQNQTRAAFEAAWLAHAVVDGLTPAHHYPYEEELVRLRGADIASRTSAKEKLIMPGATLPKRLSNNWQMWGDKGLLATHFAFEWGVAVMITPLRLSRALPDETDITNARELGIGGLFKQRAAEVDALNIYKSFYASGWTPKLAKTVRRELLPYIVNTVTLCWHMALEDSQAITKQTRKPKR